MDSVVYAFNRGESPTRIQESFESLTLAQIHGAIAFYLDHQSEIDRYLEEAKREYRELVASGIPMSEANPDLWRRIEEYRGRMSQAEPAEQRP